ncbi:MAG: hypothetical protein WC929_08540 [Bacilli bacterium]|jgi:hypothetical protein
MMPKIGLFPGEETILDRLNKEGSWNDLSLFMKCLRAGNTLISIMPTDSFACWQLHQQWNREMHESWASKNNEEVVIGFFDTGKAEEISLFEKYDKFSSIYPNDQLIIGRGLEVLSHRIYAHWDTSKSQEFDECFSMGGEEKYDAETRLYTRKSMSGRHDYVLKVEPKPRNEVTIVEAGGKTWN